MFGLHLPEPVVAKILIVEDDAELADRIREVLSRDNHTLELASCAKAAEDLLEFTTFDLLVMDWNLPDGSGIEICSKFRSNRGMTPILMLTARAESTSVEHGLDAGCDDYLTKPFDVGILKARVRALLRRAPAYQGTTMNFGSLSLDLQSRTATFDGRVIELQPREFALLELLMRNPGQALSTEAILQRVWSSDSSVNVETVYTYMTKLRKKIVSPGKPTPIKTVHRIGYRLDEE